MALDELKKRIIGDNGEEYILEFKKKIKEQFEEVKEQNNAQSEIQCLDFVHKQYSTMDGKQKMN